MASYAKNGEIQIPIFDGADYNNWKIRVLKFLQFKKCKEVAIRVKNKDDVSDKWEEMDVQATNYIYSAISNKQLEYISNLESTYQIMKKFDEMYLKKSTALQIVCRNNLENMKLQNYSEVNLFFDDFEKSVNELKQAGASISEIEKLNYMIRALPSSYSHIGDLVDVIPEHERTVDYLKSKIKLKSIEENPEKANSTPKSNVFKAETKNSSATQSKLTCYNCGKPNHLKKDCRYKNNYNRGRGRDFSNNRGRGSYNYQRGRGNFQPNSRFENQGNQGNSFHTTTIFNNNTLCEEKPTKGNEITWLLDSGCTDHIINSDKYFENFETLTTPVKVKVGDGRILEASKVGSIKTNFQVYGKLSEVTITKVFYVKEMKANLLSYSKITDNHSIVSRGRLSKIYNYKGQVLAIAIKQDRLYVLKSYMSNNLIQANLTTFTVKEKLHRTLGHVNFNNLKTMCKEELLEGIPKEIEEEYMKCAICIENKMHNLPFKNNRRKAEGILEIVHTDLNGPHRTPGNQGEKYFLSFIDDYSKLAKVYCIQSKDQVYGCLVQYVNECQNLTGKMIKELICDNGKEYINSRTFQFAREKGIIIKPCPAYVHQLNGTAERFNRTIMDMARCLLSEAKVERRYWPEIVKAAAYLKNRTLTNTIERKTPYEIFFRRRPSFDNLRIYGSKVFVRVPEVKRLSKFDKKAEAGILLGYTDVGYRVLINNKIIVARHCDIIEKDVKCIGFTDEQENTEKESEIEKDTKSIDKIQPSDEINIEENKQESKINGKDINLRRSKREVKKPVRFDDEYSYYCVYANLCDAMIPDNFQEAISCDDSKQWEGAMNREMDSLAKNNTWTLVNRPVDKKVIDVKWVYKKKSENEYKARLVVRGFQQTDCIDDTYSPVAKMQTLKVLLSYCCQESLNINQMDVETAFLNGKVMSEIYVQQPPGYEDSTSKVYKLNKSLYGLKESPRAWYECVNNFLSSLGFRRSKYDYCLYVNSQGEIPIYILLFVDDMLICCKCTKTISDVKNKLMNKFTMKDMGKVKNYIGIDIEYDYEKCNTMTLSQKSYIESLAKRYKIENSRLPKIPMEINLKLEPANVNDDVKYRNLIGALLYISSGTRPDISFSVNYLSRFQNCYDETHFKHALRVLKYLYLTRDLKLTFCKSTNADLLDCYVDSDFAGDIVSRKSTTGYVIRFYGNSIYWKSKKQNCVTKSSSFAEYVSLSEAVTEIIFITSLIQDVFQKECKPVKIYEDNSGALAIAKYGNFTKNSKHIEVHYHYVHENVKNKNIDVVKVSSENNVSDIFTKSLGNIKFLKFRTMLGIL